MDLAAWRRQAPLFYVATEPVAAEATVSISELFAIERDFKGEPPAGLPEAGSRASTQPWLEAHKQGFR
ncbi:MAG: hypothetical protein DI546_09195 [Rhizobium sp.]|nr:MAG: hypothetical protein DI546_09195 [Rhizobium sp.]